MLNLAHEHVDGEYCLNASNGEYQSCLINKMEQSSSAKNDCKRRGEFVASIEKRDGNKQKQGHENHGKFDEIMNKSCHNHGFHLGEPSSQRPPHIQAAYHPAGQ